MRPFEKRSRWKSTFGVQPPPPRTVHRTGQTGDARRSIPPFAQLRFKRRPEAPGHKSKSGLATKTEE